MIIGDRLELTIGAVAHGGHCVARVAPDGLVVFVRHALPGERVLAEVTEVHRGYARADAVRILSASADRVPEPCPYARPGLCGGCDLQHVAVPVQRQWKAAVLREQLERLAGLTAGDLDELGVRVEALPGGPLGWRTRVRYAVDAAGRAGLLQHRSHRVVPVDHCRIAHPALQRLPVTGQHWPGTDAVQAVASSTGETVIIPVRSDRPPFDLSDGSAGPGGESAGGAGSGGAEPGGPVVPRVDGGPGQPIERGPGGVGREVREKAVGREWALPVDAFWQVHPAAPDSLAAAVLDLLAPLPGETAWDLYGGAGLFAAAVAAPLGPTGRVTLVESAPAGVAAARANLADLPVEIVHARVETALARRRLAGPVDLVVLDPPRSGAGARVVRAIAAARPRAVAYVACDPAALARDVRTFRDEGWRLAALRGYDCFPMTQHLEAVALLVPPDPSG
ncbi:class I SAM-dependent RNA methyltransferase [Rhizomonospora bruguierae]|uniref:class I SAM-dependent RNA methyltransferase n=1 Tax=Rhizomonospora bruguierae TaxID=1581705 RepID=UPI001BCC3462|nr:TRAM domain-containing protein [Micromonospora sp. NBRC 107566]